VLNSGEAYSINLLFLIICVANIFVDFEDRVIRGLVYKQFYDKNPENTNVFFEKKRLSKPKPLKNKYLYLRNLHIV